MKESIRCCISCILPCGALDVIRIVHSSGRVEEISRSVCARDIMRAYPKHVLRKPPSSSSSYIHHDDDDGSRHAVVLPPGAELERGKIYFLMPVATSPAASSNPTPRRRRKKKVEDGGGMVVLSGELHSSSEEEEDKTRLLLSDRYLSEILSENKQRDRRRGRAGVWRPHLESIEEVITTSSEF